MHISYILYTNTNPYFCVQTPQLYFTEGNKVQRFPYACTHIIKTDYKLFNVYFIDLIVVIVNIITECLANWHE